MIEDLATGDVTGVGETSLRTAAADGVDRTTPEATRSLTRDPIDLASGEVILRQTDVRLPGVLPLTLERTHVSSYRCGRWFGISWASTLDQRLEVGPSGACYTSADGMVLVYPRPTGRGDRPVLPRAGPCRPLRHTADGSYELADPLTGRVLHFGPGGGSSGELPLRAVTDRNANRLEVHYDDAGAPVEVVHSGGYGVAVSTERGRITALRLADGTALARLGYDADGHLTEVIDPLGVTTRFGYDAAGRLTGWTDRNGFRYRYVYDEAGRAVAGHGTGDVLNTRLEYRDHVTVVTDSLGNPTTYRLNDRGRVIAETDPLGHTVRSVWDGHDRLLARTDPLGHTTRYTYDVAGAMISIVRPDGGETRAELDGSHLPVRLVEPGGATWRYSYDVRGNLVEMTDPAGGVMRYGVGVRGEPRWFTDPLGATTRLETNAAGLPIVVTDPLGGVTRYGRDGLGRVSRIIDPVVGVTRLEWSVDGRLLSRTFPSGSTETWQYDAEGNPTALTDRTGQVTRLEYGPFDVPTVRTAPDGTRLSFSYDSELRLTAVTNPAGDVWHYRFDRAGRLISEIDFNGRVLRYSYDAAGRLSRRVNGAGQAVDYTRDASGNIVEARSGDQVIRFGHDAAGRLVRAVNADADLTLTRDPMGRILTETCGGRTLTSAYDAAGRRVNRRTPSGSESVWRHDQAGRAVALRAGGQDIRFVFDHAGREVRRHLGTAAVMEQQWDPDHLLVAQTLSDTAVGGPRTLQHRVYAYRPDGRLIRVRDGAGERHFDLDRTGRVTAVRAENWSERYAYDAAGNVTEAFWPGSMESDLLGDRAYAGTLLRRAGRVHFDHDGQGRVVARRYQTLSGQRRVWYYTWDAFDRMVGVLAPDGRRWHYRYDALGRRVVKERLPVDGHEYAERTVFTWDGPRLAEQVRLGDGSDGAVTSWNYQPGGFAPLTQTERLSLPDRPQEWYDQRFYAVVTDRIGSPAELVDPAGRVENLAPGTLWGLGHTGEPDGADCPLRFPGQYHDPETGLSYNYFRYYDPATGRYDTPDPLGFAPQPNPYAYAANPNEGIDPLGLAVYEPGRTAERGFDQYRVGRLPRIGQVELDFHVGHRMLADQIGRAGVMLPGHPPNPDFPAAIGMTWCPGPA